MSVISGVEKIIDAFHYRLGRAQDTGKFVMWVAIDALVRTGFHKDIRISFETQTKKTNPKSITEKTLEKTQNIQNDQKEHPKTQKISQKTPKAPQKNSQNHQQTTWKDRKYMQKCLQSCTPSTESLRSWEGSPIFQSIQILQKKPFDT